MSIADQFMLGMQAYNEIQAEINPENHITTPDKMIPTNSLSTIQTGNYPPGSLLLGLAEDGLPIMLDLYDPVAGPLLVAGDRASGKTTLLKSLARASDLQDPGEIQFGVITPFPEEWEDLENLSNCLGIWPAYHPSASDFLSQVISWADSLVKTRQVLLIMVDGFDLLNAGDTQIRHSLRWLFMYGPERQAWPIVSVNPGRINHLDNWVDHFQTRILGQVKRHQTARLLVDDDGIDLSNIQAGYQFCLARPDSWKRFWIPPL